MQPEEQRTKITARRRRRVVNGLGCASCMLHICALICILLILNAGTYLVSWDSQTNTSFDHPGDSDVSLRIFALVQFTLKIGPVQPQIHWYLNSLAWAWFSSGEIDSAGFVYRGVAHTLRFPDTASAIMDSLERTDHGDIFYSCDDDLYYPYICTDSYDSHAVEAFQAAPDLSVPTGAAFTFYTIVGLLTFMLAPLKCHSWTRKKVREAPFLVWPKILLGINGSLCIAHLIASACVTGAAAQVRNYLTTSPSLAGVVYDVQFGSSLLVIVWCAFLASILGTGVWFCRLQLKQRWGGLLEVGQALEMTEAREQAERRQQRARERWRARAPGVNRAPSEHASVRTVLPSYEENDPNGLAGKIPSYEEAAAEASTPGGSTQRVDEMLRRPTP